MGENICGYISEKGELYRTQEELSKSRAKKKKKKRKEKKKPQSVQLENGQKVQ